MSGIAAECTNPNCKHIFESSFFSGISAHNINLTGNTTRCIKCGSIAKIIDGNFSFDGEGELIVNDAPKETMRVLKRLKQIKYDIEKNKDIKIDEILSETNLSGTSIGNALQYLSKRKGISIVIGLLIFLFTAAEEAHAVDLNELFDQVVIATGLVNKEEAKELIDLRKATAGKEDSPHADADSKDDEATKPASSKQKPKRSKPKQSEAHKERQKQIANARSMRCPSQAPKKGK